MKNRGINVAPVTKMTIKEQNERFRLLISYMKNIGLYESNIQICEELDMNKSHFSSVVTGKVSPLGVAKKICRYYDLPFLTWIETGQGVAPLDDYVNSSKYIGNLEETDTIESKLSKSFSAIVLPKNIYCKIVFTFRGKMYFVNEWDNFSKFINAGNKYFIELDNGQKMIKRITERRENDTRLLTLIEPDNSIPPFEIPINKTSGIYNIIASLEFNL